MSTKVTVYRFRRVLQGREISPKHMMGTLESISLLDACKPILTTARIIDAKLLESGFYFEDTKSIFTRIDDPQRAEVATETP